MNEPRSAAGSDPASVSISPAIATDAKKCGEITPSSEQFGCRIVCLILGAVLLAAAGFKAHALWTDPNPPLAMFLSPRWQLVLIEIETLLGLWLISGISPSTAWIASLGVFGFLAAVSVYLATLGLPSCGCFGKVPINPWYTSVMDGLALVALWYWRPNNHLFALLITGTAMSFLRQNLPRFPGAVLLLALASVGLYVVDRTNLLAELRNESITVEPAVLDIGEGANGEVRTVQVHVQNHSGRPIRITGGTANCKSVVIRDLPITVPASSLASFQMEIMFRGVPGLFQRPFVLYTDDVNQAVVPARLRGQISEGKGQE